MPSYIILLAFIIIAMMLIAGARVVTHKTATISANIPNEVAVRTRTVKPYVTGAPRTWIKRATSVSVLATAPASFVPCRVALHKVRIFHNTMGTQMPLLKCGARKATSQAKTVSRPKFGMRAGSAMYHSPIGMLSGEFELAADEARKGINLASHGTDDTAMDCVGHNSDDTAMDWVGYNSDDAAMDCVGYNTDDAAMDCVGHNSDDTGMDWVGHNSDDTAMDWVGHNSDDTAMDCTGYNYNYTA
ncbi:hypothetical protein J3F82_005708, partial [Coemansia sp. RSA 637]